MSEPISEEEIQRLKRLEREKNIALMLFCSSGGKEAGKEYDAARLAYETLYFELIMRERGRDE